MLNENSSLAFGLGHFDLMPRGMCGDSERDLDRTLLSALESFVEFLQVMSQPLFDPG